MKYNLIELDVSGPTPLYSIKYNNLERHPGPCLIISMYPKYAKWAPHGEEEIAKEELRQHVISCIKDNYLKALAQYERIVKCLG